MTKPIRLRMALLKRSPFTRIWPSSLMRGGVRPPCRVVDVVGWGGVKVGVGVGGGWVVGRDYPNSQCEARHGETMQGRVALYTS